MRHFTVGASALILGHTAALAASTSASDDALNIPSEQTPAARLQLGPTGVDPTAAITVPVQDTDMSVFWKEGVRFETSDKSFTTRLTGRIHFDSTFVSNDDDTGFLDTEDNLQVRRARISLAGTMYENFAWKTQYEFVEGEVGLRDIYIQFKDVIGGADFVVGQSKQPFGLEQMASSNDLQFVERGSIAEIVPNRAPGAKFAGRALDGDLTWSAGFFGSDADGRGRSFGDSSYGLTGRLTYAYDNFDTDEGRDLIHLGAAYSIQEVDGVDFGGVPEASVSDWIEFADAGATDADYLGLETAAVFGPLTLQGEYVRADIDLSTGTNEAADSYYVLASYFLTGEQRVYKNGAFRGVYPNSNWNTLGDGTGAWEVSVRYSSLDYSDLVGSDSELDNVTLGVAWYLNPAVRVVANYVRSDVNNFANGVDADEDIFAMRWELRL